MKTLVVGSIVVLNSGGPLMTVDDTKLDRARQGDTIHLSYCLWFSKNGESQGHWFDNRCLREPTERDFA